MHTDRTSRLRNQALLIGGVTGIVLGRYCSAYLLGPLLLVLAAYGVLKLADRVDGEMPLSTSVQSGHALWFLIGGLMTKGMLTSMLIELLIFVPGIVFLNLRPTRAVAMYLTFYQVVGALSHLYALFHLEVGTGMHRAVLVHMVLRLIAVTFIWMEFPRGSSVSEPHLASI